MVGSLLARDQIQPIPQKINLSKVGNNMVLFLGGYAFFICERLVLSHLPEGEASTVG